MASSVDIDSTVFARSLPRRRERAILRHADWRTMAFEGRFDRHAAVTAACVSLSPRACGVAPPDDDDDDGYVSRSSSASRRVSIAAVVRSRSHIWLHNAKIIFLDHPPMLCNAI